MQVWSLRVRYLISQIVVGAGRERAKIINPRRTLEMHKLPAEKQLYDVRIVRFHVYLSALFAEYNVTNE